MCVLTGSRFCALAAAANQRMQKDKPPTVQSHNNEKDFQRRLDTWSRLKADELDEMSAKVNSVRCCSPVELAAELDEMSAKVC